MALSLSGAPVWRSPWNQRAWGLVEVPIKVSTQLGSIWEALAGEEEPGGREEQRTSGDGRRGVGKRRALRRSPPFKNSRRGWDSLFCKKVKVSPFTFIFCVVNCCNTSQLLLLTGSRLLKLLKTTKCISTRIFVCLFLFNFLLLQKTIATSS